MRLKTKRFVCAALMLVYSWLPTPAAAQGHTVQGVPGFAHRQKCLEVGCAPRRITYGYYPTTWRRWPTEMLAPTPTPAATPAAEQLPSPAAGEQPSGKIEPEQPTIAPDDATLVPTEQQPEPEKPVPTTQPDTMLPYADKPPELPAETPGGLPAAPSSPAPTKQDFPAPAPSPPAEDAPPTMPDDNPFKDDPPAPSVKLESPDSKAPDSKTTYKQTSLIVPATERGANARWRVSGKPEVAAAGAARVTRIPAGQEPALVRPSERVADGAALVPAATPARHNPLRLTATGTRQASITPTAAWTAAEREPAGAMVPVGRNPLRDN